MELILFQFAKAIRLENFNKYVSVLPMIAMDVQPRPSTMRNGCQFIYRVWFPSKMSHLMFTNSLHEGGLLRRSLTGNSPTLLWSMFTSRLMPRLHRIYRKCFNTGEAAVYLSRSLWQWSFEDRNSLDGFDTVPKAHAIKSLNDTDTLGKVEFKVQFYFLNCLFSAKLEMVSLTSSSLAITKEPTQPV